MSRSFNRWFLIGSGLAVLLLVVNLSLSVRNAQSLFEDFERVRDTHEELMSLQKLIEIAQDAERGQRGYLITLDKSYLEPYEQARKDVDAQMGVIRSSLAANPQAAHVADNIEQALKVKMDELAETLNVLRTQGYGAARKVVLTHRGTGAMTQLRKQIDLAKKVIGEMRAQRVANMQASYRVAMITGVMSGLATIFAVIAYSGSLRRHVREQERATAEIDAQRQFYLTTLVSIGDGVITTDREGNVTHLNGVSERLTGWSSAEAEGKPLAEVFRIVNETTRETVESPTERAIRDGVIVGLANHTVLLARDGVERPIDDSAAPIKDSDGKVVGCVLIFRDISERRQAEIVQSESAARFKSVVDHVPDGIITFRENGTIDSFNTAAEELFGYRSTEVVGQNLALLFADPSYELGREVEGKRKDGTVFPLETAVNTFRLADSELSTAILRDITDRKRTEEELRRIAADLSEANRRKDAFLATLAHELRNPLAPVRNAVELMRLTGPNEDTLQKGREVIERQVTHLTRLIDDLLDVSRITRNKLELRLERVQLSEIIFGAVETSTPVIDAKDHRLSVNIPKEPVWIYGDAIRLSQVFMNLLTNAAKYTPVRGRIGLTATLEANQVVVVVKDDGIGIAPEAQPHLFEMFFQAHGMADSPQSGLGIGLSLVRHLIELHGGTVTVHSEGRDKGSEFTVRLPLAGEEPTAPVDEPQKIREGDKKMRILVVDDNDDIASTLSMLLEASGHTTFIATDGQRGVEMAEELRPDAVLLDIGMPKLNGYEACRAIRDTEWGKSILLIALTGWGQDDDRRRTSEAGFDAHLVKPVDLATLDRVLSEKGRAAE